MFAAARLIAAKDLRLRLRDRSFLIVGIIAPLGLAFIFNLIFGGFLVPGGLDLQYGIVDLDRSQSSQALGEVLDQIEAEGFIEVFRYDDRDAAIAAVEDEEIDAFMLVPSGFDEALAAGKPTLEVIGDIDQGTATSVAAAIARQYGAGVDAARLAVVTAAQILGQPPTPDLIGRLGDPATAAFTAEVVDVDAQVRQLDGTTYLTAGMAVFFLFFTVQSAVLGLLDEERDGTLVRLFAAPVRRHAVILGKALLAVMLGIVAMATLIIASTFLMGAEWGPPLGVAVVTLAAIVAASSIIGVIAGLARTPEAAENLGSIIAVVFGMLGGVFFPIDTNGGALALLSSFTPHHWFLRGLGEIAGGAPWTDALPSAGVLLGIAVVFGAIGWWSLNRRFER
ncbi:MAG: ABC transporter permease [Actinomycetes bacterium]|jgi:ABC-2 type transport system permease protein|nr:MAG: hypothetical protein DIU67_11835 [Actinomycetota bacterium]